MLAAGVLVAAWAAAIAEPAAAQPAVRPSVVIEGEGLCILVTDPLAKELACSCVAGFAQRRYEALALVLERRLDLPCTCISGTKLEAYWDEDSPVHLIIGKHSEVIAQAEKLGREVRPIASLTDKEGETTLRGLFVVRHGNPARSLADLGGYELILGPSECDEKHSAAVKALEQAGVAVTAAEPAAACTDAANRLMKQADDDKVAAVISDYARVLLEGCGNVPPGSLRVVGRTEPVPFITAFATDDLAPNVGRTVLAELLAADRFPTLLKLIESKNGFKPFEAPKGAGEVGWTDFCGPTRNGLVPALPDTLDRMRPAWSVPLEGEGLGGVAATGRWVIVTDHLPATSRDCLKVLDVETGRLVRRIDLVRPPGPQPDEPLDYGDSVRATPVVRDGRVYVLDAFGALFVRDLPRDGFGPVESTAEGFRTDQLVERAELSAWGVSSTPLVVGDRLIVNVCGAETSLVSLDIDSLTPVWKGAGEGTGYASCIAGTFGGRRQIIGYQSKLLGGWDFETGELLWTIRPERDGDFNVPSPVAVDDRRLLVATENNGMRIYEFDETGLPAPEPIAVNEEIVPDVVTPVVVGPFVYCASADGLFRANVDNGLQVDWSTDDADLADHVSLIADSSGKRLLVVTGSGRLLLFDISGARPRLTSRRSASLVAPDGMSYSHPAVVGNRLYMRGVDSLDCLAF